MSMTPRFLSLFFALSLCFASISALAKTPAKQLFGAATSPSAHVSEVFGGYAKGCLAGGQALTPDGPNLEWQAMRPSRKRHYGHPDLIGFIERLAVQTRKLGWGSLLVGDMAQARGGPMLTGHRSHQTGIDVDIWMLNGISHRLSPQEREEMSSISVLSKNRKSTNQHWTPLHPLVLYHAATDPAVARIFVNGAIKKRLCVDLRNVGAPTDWLRKIRPWYGHHYHFHIRLRCPDNSPGCQNQKPPPPGDGCGAAVDWWISDAVLNPKPKPPGTKPAKPKPPLTLADLPEACRAVLEH